MTNMMKLMKQAAAMQKDMQRVQEELAEKTVEASSGGGMVTVTAKGNLTLGRLRIDPSVVDAEDVELLEDLVLAAVNGALQAARDLAAQEMGRLTGGLGMPGLQPPL